MLMEEINDDDHSLDQYVKERKNLDYDRLYINTPVRPLTESHIKALDHENMQHAVEVLQGTSIELLVYQGYQSEIRD